MKSPKMKFKATMKHIRAAFTRVCPMLPIHGTCTARPLLLVFVLIGASGCRTYKPAIGASTPWTGNITNDLATVHVHYLGPLPYKLGGSIFDEGTVVYAGSQYAPGMWLFKSPGLYNALFGNETVVHAGSQYAHQGGPQLRRGNEVLHTGSLLFPFDVTWHRLPGDLTVTFYLDDFDNVAQLSTVPITALAGRTYNYTLTSFNGRMQFTPQTPQGQGRIYFYRPSRFVGNAMRSHIFINSELVGESINGCYFYVDRPPGDYTVRCSHRKGDTHPLTLNLESGGTKYVRTHFESWNIVPTIEENDNAIKAISKCSYAPTMFP